MIFRCRNICACIIKSVNRTVRTIAAPPEKNVPIIVCQRHKQRIRLQKYLVLVQVVRNSDLTVLSVKKKVMTKLGTYKTLCYPSEKKERSGILIWRAYGVRG